MLPGLRPQQRVEEERRYIGEAVLPSIQKTFSKEKQFRPCHRLFLSVAVTAEVARLPFESFSYHVLPILQKLFKDIL